MRRMSTSDFNPVECQSYVENSWGNTEADAESIIAKLCNYIRIENCSPGFTYDPEKAEEAATFLRNWAQSSEVTSLLPGLTAELVTLDNPDPTPVIPIPKVVFVEIPSNMGSNAPTVFMYGHYDKQPPMDGWSSSGPYEPDIRVVDGAPRLFGRGGADDGYSLFASVDCVRAVAAQGLMYPRVVILIEGEEESGSPYLLQYVDQLANRIGTPDVVFCLDSGAPDYSTWWLTASLRGLTSGLLTCSLLSTSIHSGSYGGIARDAFHVIRELLDRVDDNEKREMKVLQAVEIPREHYDYASNVAEYIGDGVWNTTPFNDGSEPQVDACTRHRNRELMLNKTWRPQLAIVSDDLPSFADGGSVLAQSRTVKLSVRLPPDVDNLTGPDGRPARRDPGLVLKRELERDPPMGCKVTYEPLEEAALKGFVCPPFANYLSSTFTSASQAFFGNDFQAYGEGGTIPFIGDLQRKFPNAQFVVTGCLGPKNNAHGPNESMNIPFVKKVVCCMAWTCYAVGQHHQSRAVRYSKL